MIIAKSCDWMIHQEGYQRKAFYYNYLGTTIECIQKDSHCIVYIYQHRRGTWVEEFFSKDEANKYIQYKISKPFKEGGWVRDKKKEKMYGIRK